LKTKSGEFAAKAESDEIVDGDDEEPVSRGENDGKQQVSPSTNGLHTASETEESARNSTAPAVRGKPTLHAALENSGAMKAKIDENTDGNEDAQAESCADGLGGGFESGGSLFAMAMALACENEQPDGSENGGGSSVKEALEGVDAEGIGDGNFVFAGNE
jgi:hypothetical protein